MAEIDLISVARKSKYPLEAFAFVQRGLDFTVRRLHGEAEARGEDEECESRHVSGQQLCHGLRDFAIEQYGLLARGILKRWKITSCDDFGHIVFAMVESELMRKTDHDRVEDFAGVFDFAEAFAPDLTLTKPAGT